MGSIKVEKNINQISFNMHNIRNLLVIILATIGVSCSTGNRDISKSEGTNIASIAVPESRSGFRSEEYFLRLHDGKTEVGTNF